MAKGLKDYPPAAQVGVLCLLALLPVAVVFYFYVYPFFDQRSTLDTQVTQLEDKNKKNQAFEQKLTEYRTEIAQISSQLETLRSMVPDQPATDEFMKMVFHTASDSGIHVRTFVPQPPVTKDYYVEQPFKVRLDGTYWALKSYFERLAKEQRIVSVTDLTLGSPSGGGMGSYDVSPGESVGADCLLVTYYSKAGGRPKPASPPR